jgi:hypothetical protein
MEDLVRVVKKQLYLLPYTYLDEGWPLGRPSHKGFAYETRPGRHHILTLREFRACCKEAVRTKRGIAATIDDCYRRSFEDWGVGFLTKTPPFRDGQAFRDLPGGKKGDLVKALGPFFAEQTG